MTTEYENPEELRQDSTHPKATGPTFTDRAKKTAQELDTVRTMVTGCAQAIQNISTSAPTTETANVQATQQAVGTTLDSASNLVSSMQQANEHRSLSSFEGVAKAADAVSGSVGHLQSAAQALIPTPLTAPVELISAVSDCKTAVGDVSKTTKELEDPNLTDDQRAAREQKKDTQTAGVVGAGITVVGKCLKTAGAVLAFTPLAPMAPIVAGVGQGVEAIGHGVTQLAKQEETEANQKVQQADQAAQQQPAPANAQTAKLEEVAPRPYKMQSEFVEAIQAQQQHNREIAQGLDQNVVPE